MKRHQRMPTPAEHEVCDFQVIGELRAEPKHLLLLGDDRACYAMDSSSGRILPLEPDDSWAVDLIEHASLRLEVSKEIVA